METMGIGSRVNHPAFGKGVIIRISSDHYEISFLTYGIKKVRKDYDQFEIIEAVPAKEAVTFSDAEKALIRILRTWSDASEVVEIGERWEGGQLILRPGSQELKDKTLPISTFFHKIVMVRDRLRVMEQRINSSKNLSDEEKVNLQQYLTRIYGSLTTFNVLFKYRKDHFVGERSG